MSIKILLTGSTGFIGRNLKEYLQLEDKYQLLAPTHYELDLQDSISVRNYLKKHKPHVVIHTANCNDVTYGYSHHEVLNGNLRMFFNLERYRTYYGKMIYFGSGAEYDRITMEPMVNEEDFDKSIPKESYDFSKYIMRKYTEHTDNIYNLCLFGVFGKYEEYKRRFISNNICKSILGLSMTVRQNAKFDYLFIDDLCLIIDYFICNTPQHKVYNVCTGRPIELVELAKLINDVTGLNQKILVAQEGYQREYSASNDRLLKEIGEIHFTEHRTAIEQLVEYYNNYKDDWYLE